MSAEAADQTAVPGTNDDEVLPKVVAAASETNGSSKSAEENKFQQAIAAWRSKSIL